MLTTLLGHVAALIHITSGCACAGTAAAEVALACVWFAAFLASGFPVFRDDVTVFDELDQTCVLASPMW